MPVPYVGVTGMTDVDEMEKVVDEFEEAGFPAGSNYGKERNHKLMVGVLASDKTRKGQEVSNRRYPHRSQWKDLFSAAQDKTYPMFHYNTHDKENLFEETVDLFDGIYDEDLCRGMQMNIVWPPVEEVENIKSNFPGTDLVLQLSDKSMSKEDYDNEKISDRVENYGNNIDYVLIDPSGGRGKEFDIDNSVELYRELEDNDFVLGFAGGLKFGNTAGKVARLCLRLESKCFAIDAESGLRDDKSERYGDDVLNMEKVKGYAREAASVLL